MLKQNDEARKEINVDIWHSAGYTGKGVNILMLDLNGKILPHMKDYTVVIDPDNKMVNETKHNTYTVQVAHEFAPDATIYVAPWSHSRKSIIKWLKDNPGLIDIANVSLSSPVSNDYDVLKELGIITFCATGNSSERDEMGIDFPASLDWTIAVGAYNWKDKGIYSNDVTGYSNGGKMINCVAPTNVTVLNEKGDKFEYTGTSTSSPVCASSFACYVQFLKEQGVPITNVRKIISENCLDIRAKGFDRDSGYGLFCLPKTIPTESPVNSKEETMNGIDCATKLTAESAQALKQAGIEVVGRYLGRSSWKGLTLDEVTAIRNAGLKVFLIWELSPTKASYFSYAKGVSDAQQAIAEAAYLGAPEGIAIYFTVDYDAQAGDMSAIIDYFQGVKDGLGGKFLMGVYGSYAVMRNVKADRYYQTYAWSYGQKAPNHIYQYQNDVIVAGIAVDRDYVNEDAGLWGWGYEDVLDVAVVLNTDEDFWAGRDVAAQNGNCAIFIRGADSARTVPAKAMQAKKLFIIGGPTANHPNEVLLSGNTKYDTAAEVAKYLG